MKDPGPEMTYLIIAALNGEAILAQKGPLCERVDIVQDGKEVCPPKQGQVSVSASAPVWDFLDDGRHTIRLEGLTKNSTKLLCLIATAEFQISRGRHWMNARMKGGNSVEAEETRFDGGDTTAYVQVWHNNPR